MKDDLITLPMGPELMRTFFDDKTKVFTVDYGKCELKGNVFLTYVSNLGLNAEIDFEGASGDEKLDLIKNYMHSRHIVSSETLGLAVMQILMAYKGAQAMAFDRIERVLSKEEVTRFIDENEEVVSAWTTFLDSTLLFLMHSFEGLGEAMDLEHSFEVVDDQRYVGLNVVNMFGIEGFFELYFSAPVKEMKFFTRQFNEYMFNGKNLFFYFQTEENSFLKLLSGLLNEQIEFKDLSRALGAS